MVNISFSFEKVERNKHAWRKCLTFHPLDHTTYMTDDLGYREAVNRLMAMKSPEWISNGLPEHAAILFECFFKNARKGVKFLCETLDGRVFDTPGVIGAAADALKRGTYIDIIVRQEPSPSSLFLKQAFEAQKLGHKISWVTSASAQSSSIAGRRENFAVMDDSAIRYEQDISKCEAFASMNQPPLASTLTSIFNRLAASLDGHYAHNTELVGAV